MDRKTERETVFKMLFEAGFRTDEDVSVLYENSLISNEVPGTDYIKTVFFGVLNDLDSIDGIISAHSKDWKISRISRTSLCILRLSVFEMKDMSGEIPFAVSINEAIELAKKYDDDAAPRFINGILNAVAADLGLK